MTNPELPEPHPPVVPGPYPPQGYNPPPLHHVPTSPPPQIIYTQQTVVPTSTLATISLVLSILGLLTFCCSFGVLSIAAVACGHFALPETNNGSKGGHGMAITGLILGYIGAVVTLGFIILSIAGAVTPPPGSVTPFN